MVTSSLILSSWWSLAWMEWSQTRAQLSISLPLPPGTHRKDITHTLRDHHGRDLWRNTVETKGGRDAEIQNPRLTIAPAYYSTPLLDVALAGALRPSDCDYEIVTDAHQKTTLHITLAKAASDQRLWERLFLDDSADPVVAPRLPSPQQETGATSVAARLPGLLRAMADSPGNADHQLAGAAAIATAAANDDGLALVVACKACTLIAEAMGRFPDHLEIQAAGCLATLRALPSANERTRELVLSAGLLAASAAAAIRFVPLRRDATAACYAYARQDAKCRAALTGSEHATALLSSAVGGDDAAVREAACSAALALAQAETCHALSLVECGVIDALVLVCVDAAACLSWRLRCWTVLHVLACRSETQLQREMVRCGVIRAAVIVGEAAAAACRATEMRLLVSRTVAALTWESGSSELRAQVQPLLVRHSVAAHLVRCAAVEPVCAMSRCAALCCLAEEAAVVNVLRSDEEMRVEAPVSAAPFGQLRRRVLGRGGGGWQDIGRGRRRRDGCS